MRGEFDLQRPELGIDPDQEVNLTLIARPEIARVERPVGVLQCGQYLSDDKPLPTRADPGLTQQRSPVRQVQQGVQQPGVPPVHLGPLDETLADVRLIAGRRRTRNAPSR